MDAIRIPGRQSYHVTAVVLDLNGTVAIGGEVVPGTAKRVRALREAGVTCYLLTADTRGRGAATAASLGLVLQLVDRGNEAVQKAAFIEHVGAEHVFAVGNGANDAEMLRAAAIGVAVIQPEGTAMAALQAADLVVPDINAALDLLLDPSRLIATLRI
jgi:P-type E1-E2 ATPase